MSHPPKQAGGQPMLVMRASESVWRYGDNEGKVLPGKRRPFLVVDEMVTHLAHTDRNLSPELLLDRVKAVLTAQNVPVNVEIQLVSWLKDKGKTRPRLVAELAGASFGDVKIVMGVDYIGRWASITQQIGFEPEPAPKEDVHKTPNLVWVLVVIGVLTLPICVGLPILIWAYSIYTASKGQHRAQQLFIQAERVVRQQDKLFARTYRVDDMRLFCSAMCEVFKLVVDDLVDSGGEVMRISGGQGGFFNNGGLVQAGDQGKAVDAGALEV